MQPFRTQILRIALLVALFALPAHGAVTNMLTGLSAPVGVAADRTTNTLYFVEFVGGTLKRVSASTTCSTTSAPPCSATTIASGFVHPEDVALDLASNTAYVTTRDDPGTTGALWRVDLATGTRTLVTFNLGAPQQIALDVATNSAYVVGYDTGRLWKIDLTTGSKLTMASLLDHPVGLVITSNRAYAYVTEQGAAQRLSKIDLATGARVATVASALTSPFFLSWTDPGESTLYLVERSPNNDVLRIDLPTTDHSAVITGLPANATGIAVDWMGGRAYITSNASIVRADLGALPASAPVFLGVGFVPVSDITAGYATTSTPRISAKDAPFGGTLDIFANLDHFRTAYPTSSHYRVLLDGNPLSNSWSNERFNTVTGRFEPVTVAPTAALTGAGTNTLYQIPPEYPTVPERWYPPYLAMRWPSTSNGLHTFTIELYENPSTGVFNQLAFSAGDAAINSLTVLIDNDPPQVDLLQVYQVTAGPLQPIATCAIVSSGLPQFEVGIKAYDPNGHLLNYTAWANWGHNRSGNVIPTENYDPGHVVPSRMWYGVMNLIGPSSPPWTATCNCAHIFYVGAWKRTINGYWLISYGQAHQAITINNVASPTACP